MIRKKKGLIPSLREAISPQPRHRQHRLASLVQKELSDVFRFEVRDPRLLKLSIAAVQVSQDLSHARILIDAVGHELWAPVGDPVSPILSILIQATPALRVALGSRIGMRRVPTLSFYSETKALCSDRMDSLIQQGLPTSEASETPHFEIS